MSVSRPNPTQGLHHVALFVKNFEASVVFYTKIMGMSVEWQPDPDNIYLTSGSDNLALHRIKHNFAPDNEQRLDHIGFILGNIGDVDEWYTFLTQHQVSIRTAPRTHRDGARSFYCYDPDGNTVQIIYHPRLAKHS